MTPAVVVFRAASNEAAQLLPDSLGGWLALLVTTGVVAAGAWRIVRALVHIQDALKQLEPNGGESLRDAVNRIEASQGRAEARDDRIETKVDRTEEKVASTEEKVDRFGERLDAVEVNRGNRRH